MPADLAERDELLDLELMNRIGHRRASSSVNCAIGLSLGPCPVPLEIPAARITLSTPAAKPSSRNTISPHGEIPSQRSSTQPMNAPTRTPATSSVESRKPRASADGSALRTGPSFGLPARPLLLVEPFAETLEPRGESGLFG